MTDQTTTTTTAGQLAALVVSGDLSPDTTVTVPAGAYEDAVRTASAE